MQKLNLCCVLVLFLCAVNLVAQRSKPSSRPTSRPSTGSAKSTGSSAGQRAQSYPRALWQEKFDRPVIDGLVEVGGQAVLSRVGTAVAVDVTFDKDLRAVASSLMFKPGRRLRFEKADRLTMRVRVTPTEAGGRVSFRINCFDGERKAAFSKGVFVEAGEWCEVSVLLRTMVPYYGVPRWNTIERFGLQLYTAGRFEVESVALVADSSGASPYWLEEKVRVMAFGDLNLRRIGRSHLVVMTDADRVKGEILDSMLGEVQSMSRMIADDFGKAVSMRRPVFILLFAKETRYRSFWNRVAREYGAQIDSPGEFLNAQLGFVTAWVKKRPRVVNPAWVDACTQAVLMQRLGLAVRSDWLSAGLASYYRYRNQAVDLHKNKQLRKGFGSIRKMIKIELLTAGTRLSPEELWQATSLVSWMMDRPERRAGMVKLVDRLVRAGDTNLAPHARACFGLTLPQIEKQWTAWGRAKVLGRKKTVPRPPATSRQSGLNREKLQRK